LEIIEKVLTSESENFIQKLIEQISSKNMEISEQLTICRENRDKNASLDDIMKKQRVMFMSKIDLLRDKLLRMKEKTKKMKKRMQKMQKTINVNKRKESTIAVAFPTTASLYSNPRKSGLHKVYI